MASQEQPLSDLRLPPLKSLGIFSAENAQDSGHQQRWQSAPSVVPLGGQPSHSPSATRSRRPSEASRTPQQGANDPQHAGDPAQYSPQLHLPAQKLRSPPNRAFARSQSFPGHPTESQSPIALTHSPVVAVQQYQTDSRTGTVRQSWPSATFPAPPSHSAPSPPLSAGASFSKLTSMSASIASLSATEIIDQIAEQSRVICQFAKSYALRPHTRPPRAQLENMDRLALFVFRLAEGFHRLTFGHDKPLPELSPSLKAQVSVAVLSLESDSREDTRNRNPGESSRTSGKRAFGDDDAATSPSTSAADTQNQKDMAYIRKRRMQQMLPISPMPGPAQPAKLARSRKRSPGGKRSDDQHSCESCGHSETPEWRRGPSGLRTLCNACGLQFVKMMKRGHTGTPEQQLEDLRKLVRKANGPGGRRRRISEDSPILPTHPRIESSDGQLMHSPTESKHAESSTRLPVPSTSTGPPPLELSHSAHSAHHPPSSPELQRPPAPGPPYDPGLPPFPNLQHTHYYPPHEPRHRGAWFMRPPSGLPDAMQVGMFQPIPFPRPSSPLEPVLGHPASNVRSPPFG